MLSKLTKSGIKGLFGFLKYFIKHCFICHPSDFIVLEETGTEPRTVLTLLCTENSKHIFPEIKLCGLVPNFFIHVSGSDLSIPKISLIWNLYFPVLRERTLGSTAGAERRARELPPSSGWWQFPALPSAPAVEPRVQTYKFPIWKIMNHK